MLAARDAGGRMPKVIEAVEESPSPGEVGGSLSLASGLVASAGRRMWVSDVGTAPDEAIKLSVINGWWVDNVSATTAGQRPGAPARPTHPRHPPPPG